MFFLLCNDAFWKMSYYIVNVILILRADLTFATTLLNVAYQASNQNSALIRTFLTIITHGNNTICINCLIHIWNNQCKLYHLYF